MKLGISLPQLGPQATPENLISSHRGPTMGTLAEIREDIQRLREIGVTYIVHSPPEIGFTDSTSVERALLRMEQLIEVSR